MRLKGQLPQQPLLRHYDEHHDEHFDFDDEHFDEHDLDDAYVHTERRHLQHRWHSVL